MIRRNVRRARRHHYCDNCHAQISPNQHYLECVASPNHGDLGNTTWWRLVECMLCARARGAWKAGEEIPTESLDV